MDTLKLHPDDNVVVSLRSLAAGEKIGIDGHPVTIAAFLGIGHKLACREIREGEPIIKYGIVIGTATADIAIGGHVHTQNMKSNYIPTYLNEA